MRLLPLVASPLPMANAARDTNTPVSVTLSDLDRFGEATPIMLRDWRCMWTEAEARALVVLDLNVATGEADRPKEERLRRMRGRSDPA